ncbi:MAG TPA: sigma-70 family RNA polymerase sigma factor [Bacteroidia bacterium]|nr:sigma-70 family RNA polymerase sigma factor [Bacteroidia bacterium]
MSEHQTSYHQSAEQLTLDAAQIKAAQKDTSKFGVLYKKYYEQIFLFILKRVETEDIAADITSQVFLKALTALSKYKDMGLPFSSWLFRIARNELYDMQAQHKIELVVSTEKKGIGEMINEMGEEEPADYSNLYHVLSTLEDEDMELIELRFFEKRAFKEIAEILEITENNAKVRTYRILDKLKNLLRHEK